MATVLITGGTGFIGAHLVRACLARGDRVTVLARPGSDSSRLADCLGDLQLERRNPVCQDEIDALLRQVRPEIIFHRATQTRFAAADMAYDMRRSAEANLHPLFALVSAAARVPPRVLVRTGSIAEYGKSPQTSVETQREAPDALYGASMCAGTHYLAAVSKCLPFAARTARLGLTFGAGQNADFLVAQAIRACLAGAPLHVARPEDRRDLIHVSDVVRGLLALADAPTASAPIVNLSTGRAPSMRTVARAIFKTGQADPGLLSFGRQTGAPDVLLADPDLAARTLGWRAELSLEQGLAETIAWEKSLATVDRCNTRRLCQ
jgi:nucleoside-diphosphate-sugar epimerase